MTGGHFGPNPPQEAPREPASPGGDATRRAEALRAALSEMEDLFGDIVKTAEAKSFLRCPYLNVKRECTARFECVNQVFAPHREKPLCSGQHKINFACGTGRAAGPTLPCRESGGGAAGQAH